MLDTGISATASPVIGDEVTRVVPVVELISEFSSVTRFGASKKVSNDVGIPKAYPRYDIRGVTFHNGKLASVPNSLLRSYLKDLRQIQPGTENIVTGLRVGF